jgi:hypothetical protein
MDINLPATSNYSPEIRPNVFVVLEQTARKVVVRDSDNQLLPGNILLFGQDLRGLVVESLAGTAEVVLSLPATVKYGTKLLVPNLPIPEPLTNLAGGSLQVRLSIPESYVGASLGWSLFKDSEFIAVGTASSIECSLTGSGLWPAGEYLFCVQAFKGPQPLGSAEVIWTVGSPGLALLSYGNYNDSTTPLSLQ